MQQNIEDSLITFLIGDNNFVNRCQEIPVKPSFDDDIINYLDDVSKILLKGKEAKKYPDIITFAFWIRRSSLLKYSEKYEKNNNMIRMGRGIVFHIAPSNVAVNYAYSLVSGLLAGNINIVRVPSKPFIQIDIINDAFKEALKKNGEIANYLCLVRYGHDKNINDKMSKLADVRIIWGGDDTISLIRESPLKPHATEILFANRFSLAVIDSDTYMISEDKKTIASDFYNDTFLTDQNACSSPRIIVWLGTKITEAKKEFWNSVHDVVSNKYTFQQKQGVDKYLQACITSTKLNDVLVEQADDNLITRILLKELSSKVIDCFSNSGFFLEYNANNLKETKIICDDNRCQTITYVGDKKLFESLSRSGIRGVDRIVPFGKSMDFDLIWDGYDLIASLSRIMIIRPI